MKEFHSLCSASFLLLLPLFCFLSISCLCPLPSFLSLCRSHCSSPSRPLLRRNELHYPRGLIKLQQLDAVGRFTAWLHPELSERRPGRLSRRAKSSSRFKFWCHFHRKNRSTECGSSMWFISLLTFKQAVHKTWT